MTKRPFHVTLVLVAMLWLFADSASAMLHPQQGRFMQRDPLRYVDTSSLYVYVRGEPVGHIDPFGTQATRPTRCCCKGNPDDCAISVSFLTPEDEIAHTGKKASEWYPQLTGAPPTVFDGEIRLPGGLERVRLFQGGVPVHVSLTSRSGDEVRGCNLKQKVVDSRARFPNGQAFTSEPDLRGDDYSSTATPVDGQQKGAEVYFGWEYWDYPMRRFIHGASGRGNSKNFASVPDAWFWQAKVVVEETEKVKPVFWGWAVDGSFETNKATPDKWSGSDPRRCPF